MSKPYRTIKLIKQSQEVIARYTVSASEPKKREKAMAEDEPLGFDSISEAADIFDRGAKFYKNIRSGLGSSLSVSGTLSSKQLLPPSKKAKILMRNI